jgi:hypothetical protein
VLCDLAEGICCRAYFLRSAPAVRPCMASAEWAKLRAKLDKSFPDTVEAQKVG